MSGHKNVRFGLVLSEEARERLDRLARQQGCSRAELVDRALVNLEMQMQGAERQRAQAKRYQHPDLIVGAS